MGSGSAAGSSDHISAFPTSPAPALISFADMVILRTLIILILVAGIFGGAAYFSYELYWKPQKLDAEDKVAKAEAVHTASLPPPDYTLPVFEKAIGLQRAGDTAGARVALAEFIKSYPDSPKIGDAKQALGEINASLIFSPAPSPDKTTYTVGKGDSLVKIASKTKSNAELIFRVNNMENINLQIGQQLAIPQLNTSIVVDRKAHTVTLLNNGEFLKEYPTLSLKTPGISGPAQTKVADKIALQGSNRVAFGAKDYAGSDRWVMLSASGLVIRGMPAEAKAPPPGIVVALPDIEEIFLLVSRGTPVTIQ